jgi:transposase
MKTQATELDFSEQDIYVGLDVHLSSWTVSIYTAHLEHKTFRQDPDPVILLRYLKRHFPGGRYHGVYEAGYSGFWIHDVLTAAGMDMMVINPADVPTTDRERSFKHDPVDARKLARSLRAGQLRAIYVPSREAVGDRQLVRTRGRLISKQTRVKNQIKALLRQFGIQFPYEFTRRHWSKAFIIWLESLRREGEGMPCESGAIALGLLLDELGSLRGQILEATRAIRSLAGNERYRQRVELLMSLKGIGLISAMILLSELVDIDRFRSLDHLASYAGLVPGKRASGANDPSQRLTHRRSAQLRYILIESAWVAARKDSTLNRDFERLAKRMKKSEAIIRIARKQLARVRFVLKNKKPYVALSAAA